MARLVENRFRLGECLGSGGMGIVYRAYDRLTGETIAFKQVLINPRSLNFNSQSERTDSYLALAREFQILAGLRHPYIISVLDYGFDADHQPYFTMALVEHAVAITDYARDLEPAQKVDLLLQVLYALDYLHRHQIIHRDLKPGNILVGRDGQVRVLDFGLAVSREQVGEVAGTVSYIAPEVLQGAPATFASDLYVFGIIAYQVITGFHPYESDTPSGTMRRILSGAPPELSLLPAPLKAIVERLLRFYDFERYGSAREVIDALSHALGMEAPVETPAVRESFLQAAEFVGRHVELDRLLDAFDAALSGKGSAWLIGGESGIGKSRLVSELAIRAQGRGALVLRGDSTQGGDVFFGLWRDVMRRLALAVELTDLDAGILKSIVPDIDRLLERPIPNPPAVSERMQQDRLIQTMLGIFRRAAAPEKPLLLLLEDLHWTFEGLQPLPFIVEEAVNLPVLIVATFRDDERPNLPSELPGMSLMRLARLDNESIETLSVSMLGETIVTRSMLDLLERETEGNAFFLVEAVRALADAAGGLYQVRDDALPEKIVAGGIAQVVQRRLDHVPAWGQPMLRAAAVAGRRIDTDVLSRLERHDSLLPPGQSLQTWIDTCVDVAVISLRNGVYGFDHDKLREAVLDSLPDEVCRQLNCHVAEAVEAAHPDNVDYMGVLIDHWRTAGETEKEREYARRYGNKMKSSSSYREARILYERALELLPQDSVDRQIRQERVDILIGLGTALFILSDYELAENALMESLALAREIGDRKNEATALRLLGQIDNIHGNNKRFEERFRESLAICREIDDRDGIASSLKEVAFALEIKGHYDDAMMCHEEALAIHRETNNLIGIASIINDMGIIHAQRGEYDQAEVKWNESLRIKDEIGDRRGAAATTMNLGHVYRDQGRLDQAVEYQMKAVRMWRDVGDRHYEAATLNNLAGALQDQGNYTEARYFQEESIAIKRALSDPQGLVDSLSTLAVLEMYEGNHAEAIKLEEEALYIRRELGDPRGIVSTLMHSINANLNLGQTEGITESARELASLAVQLDIPPTYAGALMTFARLAWCRDEDPERSMELLALYDTLDPNPTGSMPYFLSLFRSHVEAALSDAERAAALERGRALEVKQVLGGFVA